LKEAMGGLEPNNIMTDQDKAMNSAIALVFPDVVHRCCKFHVVSKACEKLGWLINSSEEFANKFDYCINHTETPEEFELMWHSLEESYNLRNNEAFQNMSVARTMWAPTYFRKSFFPFTSTTGRSESMNSLFKKLVHPQDSVLQFVTQYE
jgi:transposase-like protein